MERLKEILVERQSKIARAFPQTGCDNVVPPLFALDEMTLAKAELKRSGFVVFRDVIDEDLQRRFQKAMWDWLRRRSDGRIYEDDPKTWSNLHWPNSYGPGIQSSHGLCHIPEAWEIRERAAPYFEGLYSDPDLLVSFDGANIMRPTTGSGGSAHYFTPRGWLHVDSCGKISPEDSGYQGVVNVSGMDGTDGRGGCFQAVPGSHKSDFESFMEEHQHGGQNFTPVPEGHPLRERMSRIVAPDRSLVVWKNELFHCNSPNSSSEFRFAQYVNYCPRSLVSQETLEERLEAFSKGIGSTHWVHQFYPSSGACPNYTPPELTPKQQSLLGTLEDTDKEAEEGS